MKNGEGNAGPNSKRGRARRREQAGLPPAAAQEPAERRNGGAPVGAGTLRAIAHHVDCACADMTTAKWKARDGEHRRAAELLRRAQRELVAAELLEIAAAREADHAAARRG
jgi:hypothetical protein